MLIDPHVTQRLQAPRLMQLDPYKNLYKLVQNSHEVGWVYVTGTSRTNSTEHWMLYRTGNGADKQPYVWPSSTQQQVSLQFQYDAARSGTNLNVTEFRQSLETGGVTVLSVTATCTAGL